MPFQTRAARSLLALALIASLVAAGAPAAALGRQPLAAGVRSHAGERAAAQSRCPRRRACQRRRSVAPSTSAPPRPRPPPRHARPSARVAWVTRATPDVPAPKPKSISKAELAAGGGGGGSSPSSYRGRNKVWMPALGIDRSISFFSCSSNAYPGNRVYRWGCAGRNNVYLFGHAYSVFKPLHDAYVRGRLKKGMKLFYADGRGKVSTYKVIWWRVTRPDKGGFAYAGQSRPSLTLQTCVGARSQFRLIVRLVKV